MNQMTTLLSIILPILTAAGGWSIGSKKRNNDFISQLQNSIDLLTEKYTTTLNKLIAVEKQNADLIIGQNKMSREMSELKRENFELQKQVEILNSQLQDVKIITRQAK